MLHARAVGFQPSTQSGAKHTSKPHSYPLVVNAHTLEVQTLNAEQKGAVQAPSLTGILRQSPSRSTTRRSPPTSTSYRHVSCYNQVNGHLIPPVSTC